MSQRRYRHSGLSEHAKRLYLQLHYCRVKNEWADHSQDIYELATTERVPFLCIVQPRRYCTLEIDISPSGRQLTLPGQMQVREWMQTALDISSAPAKSKELAIGPTSGIVRGLELEHAKQLCQHVWDYLLEGIPDAPPNDSGGVT